VSERDDGDGDVRVAAPTLRDFATAVLFALGAPDDTARLVATSLVDADLRGVDSHGVHLLELYRKRVRAGDIVPDAAVRMTSDDGAVVHLDAGLGFGQPAGLRAVELGVERAARHGVATVITREATHLGALGYYTRRAAEAGFLALAFQNGPTVVPPYGTTTPLFSTNPFSSAVPTGEAPTIVYDVATTAVAGNKLLLAKTRGDPTIPAGWANDGAGRPTTDTEAASVRQLQWFGAHKGYGIAFLVEVMAGVAAASSFGRTEASASATTGFDRVAKGFQFVLLDTGRFVAGGDFRARMDTLIRDVHATEPAEGFERVYVPGELEHRCATRREADGIPLPSPVLAMLDAIAADVAVARLDR
jgi:LDH2 family malate/lactate/ureidoglycolate dehydrogenase